MKEKQRDFDDFLEEDIGFSNYQKLLCAYAALLSFGTSLVTQISIFASAVPDFR